MAYMTKFFLIIFAVYLVQTEAADKYTDENRPYEFGFTIDGEQHRHEKKDKNGIIMGEFGFITADGVYHVTVYATDENGNFKILSMKNIRVKPYPTSPGAGVKKANSVNPSSATKDSIPESTKHEKITKTIISSPAKSCSHCSLPPTTTLSPSIPKDASQSTNSNLPRSNNQKHINDNFENKVPRVSQNFGYQNQNDRPDSTPKIVESHPQMSLISNRFPQTIYQGGEQHPKQQIRPINAGQQKQNPVSLLSNEGQNYQSNLNPSNVSPPSSNQDISPISRHSQGPVNENNNIQKQNIAPNQQPVLEAVNLNQENSNTYNPVQNRPQQQQNHKPGSENNQAKLQGYPNIHVSGEQTISNKPVDASLDNQPIQKYTKGDRNPKTFTNFIQQAVEPEEVARTGPNLYKPSLPNPKDFSGKPELLAAQMQIVDKNTDIHHLNPGESVGLPNGISKNDMSNLLYTFNYTLGFYGHHEKGYTNGAKQGYYFVTGRNGIRTRVDYVADETGFHPKISQEILDILSDDVPKPETEKDVKYGLKGYEFKWLYFPLETKSK